MSADATNGFRAPARELSGQDLLLRQLCADDCSEAYVNWLNDPRVNRFLETRFSNQTLAMVRSFVEEKAASPTEFLYGIFAGGNLAHIGNIKLGPVNSRHLSAAVSLFIGEPDWWGKGIASEAISLLTHHALGEMGLAKLHAGMYAANKGSLAAFLKAGYREEGLLRSHVMDGNVRSDVHLVGIAAGDISR